MNNYQGADDEPHLRSRDYYHPWEQVSLVCITCAILLLTHPRIRAASALEAAHLAGSVEEYVSRLESSYHDVKTLRAEFIQTYISGGRTRAESGTVYFARGGQMRWDYREPEEKLFLSDGKKLFLYVPAEKQLTRSPAKSSDDARVPFRLLLSRLNLHRVFGQIEFADQALMPEPGNEVLRVLPKRGDEESFSEVLMELTPTFDIRRLVIHYADQSSMEFAFDRVARNADVSPTLFRFSPPAGTEIIDQAEGGN